MNTKPPSESRNDGIVATIGLLVLLLGTATGNAYAMLAMAIVAIVIVVIFFRQRVARHAWLLTGVAASVAAVVAIAITRL
jgi:hypothetical protein